MALFSAEMEVFHSDNILLRAELAEGR